MRHNSFLPLSYLLLVTTLTACNAPTYSEQSLVLDSPTEITIHDENKQKADLVFKDIKENITRINHLLSKQNESKISQLNKALVKTSSAKVSKELKEIIEKTIPVSNETHNRFNPAGGKFLDLWGFTSSNPIRATPTPEQINPLIKSNPRVNNITFDEAHVVIDNPAVKFDLDGYDKGYALDSLLQTMKSRSVKSGLINIDGTIAAIGEKSTRPWKVGIQHPRKPGPIATVELKDGESIVNATDYQRYFKLDGKRYSNNINTNTGFPEQGIQAVIIMKTDKSISNAKTAAIAKALFIAGKEEFTKELQRMQIQMAMLIDKDGEVYVTPMLARRIEFSLPKPVVHELP